MLSSGLTEVEEEISTHLIEAWNKFISLNHSNKSSSLEDFKYHMHALQRILMNRIVARDYPEYWNEQE